MDVFIVCLALAFIGLLACFAYLIKRGKEPEPPKTDEERLGEVFVASAKREEMRLEEIRDRVEEARKEASQGSGEKAREQLNRGWGKARGQ